MGDMTLLEVIVIFRWRNIKTTIRDDTPRIKWIFLGMTKRHQCVVAFALREIEGCDPTRRLDGRVTRPFQLFGERRELPLARRPVKTADPNVNGMNFPPAEKPENSFPTFFSCRPRVTISPWSRAIWTPPS